MTWIQKLKLQKSWNTSYINTEKQMTDIQKYRLEKCKIQQNKLQKCRNKNWKNTKNTNYRSAEIQIRQVKKSYLKVQEVPYGQRGT